MLSGVPARWVVVCRAEAEIKSLLLLINEIFRSSGFSTKFLFFKDSLSTYLINAGEVFNESIIKLVSDATLVFVVTITLVMP